MAGHVCDENLENVSGIIIESVQPKGYIIWFHSYSQGSASAVEKRQIELPNITNFEWRMDGSTKSFEVNHMYFGSETNNKSDIGFNMNFNVPCRVGIHFTSGPRCYLYINQ